MDADQRQDAAFLREFASALSLDRFTTYLQACAGDESGAMQLYVWNIEVSAAFWIEFHVLEVTLRNACHSRLTEMAGTEEWWQSDIALHRGSAAALRQALQHAETRDTAATPGHVVAELGLGFWTGLFARRYHQRLWVDGLEQAVPGAGGQRHAVHRSLERLRKLRNRIAHHEPIFARDLAADHRLALQTVSWVNPTIAAWLTDISRVPPLLQSRPLVLHPSRA